MEALGTVAGWILDVIQAAGYVGVVFLVALETFFPPIPSEVILPMAGFLAGQGKLWLPGVVGAATLGSLAGALGLYTVGLKVGEKRLRLFVKRYGRYAFVSEDDLDKAAGWFDRHGGLAVFIGRFMPGVRSFVSIPAGLERMPLWRFSLYTVAGAIGWNVVLAGAGYLLGENWQVVSRYIDYFAYAVLAAAVVLVGWFLWKRRQQAQA